MSKKFIVLIEDDFEIMGNGSGNVAYHQYLPANCLMNIAKRRGIKLSFMVEAAHRLALERFKEKNKSYITQAHLWDDTILEMMGLGFDVQLHLHPQWLHSRYENGFIYVDSRWNIGQYSQQDQLSLLKDSIQFLKELTAKVNENHKIIAFKAGSWGLQPSESLFSIFKKYGIRIVMGVRQGIHFPNLGIDYQDVEEPYLPYYPDPQNICRLGDDESIIMIPLQPYKPAFPVFISYSFNSILDKYRYKQVTDYLHPSKLPLEIKANSPFKKRKIELAFSWKTYSTHLKIGNQSFNYLKKTFDTVIERLMQFDVSPIPIVIECHTKQIYNHLDHIGRFIEYIQKKYSNQVCFGDMSTFLNEVINQKVYIRRKSS